MNKILNKLLKFFNFNYFEKKLNLIGLSHFLNMRINYKNINKLSDVNYKIFSQNGEDGILDYLIYSKDYSFQNLHLY